MPTSIRQKLWRCHWAVRRRCEPSPAGRLRGGERAQQPNKPSPLRLEQDGLTLPRSDGCTPYSRLTYALGSGNSGASRSIAARVSPLSSLQPPALSTTQPHILRRKKAHRGKEITGAPSAPGITRRSSGRAPTQQQVHSTAVLPRPLRRRRLAASLRPTISEIYSPHARKFQG